MHYPPALFLAGILLIALVVEMLTKWRQPWAAPMLMVYITVFAWYFVDPFQFPEAYKQFSTSILSRSYLQVAAFLAVFRWAVPRFSNLQLKKLHLEELKTKSPTAGAVFFMLLGIWIPLITIGIYRCNWDAFAALLPLGGRTEGTMTMWGRGALGGKYDSLVSAGGYLHLIVCSLLGVTLILQKKAGMALLNASFYLISIPAFLLTGNRSVFLAMISPLLLTYLIAGRQQLAVRVMLTAIFGICLHFTLLLVMENRARGYAFLFDEQAREIKAQEDQLQQDNRGLAVDEESKTGKQIGLNMIQELCFINEFADSKTFDPSYGMRYLTEITNVVPRALWPNKPMLGIDYAIWRGFGTNDASGIGVAATIATGMIGGGLLNFGPWLGAIAPALLMAVWASLLTRWWMQRVSILRLSLFAAGLGLTFNLGRDITLLVLWPIVFGFIFVKIAEFFLKKNGPRQGEPQGRRWKTSAPHMARS